MHYCFQFYVQVTIDCNEKLGIIKTLISPVKCKIVVKMNGFCMGITRRVEFK